MRACRAGRHASNQPGGLRVLFLFRCLKLNLERRGAVRLIFFLERFLLVYSCSLAHSPSSPPAGVPPVHRRLHSRIHVPSEREPAAGVGSYSPAHPSEKPRRRLNLRFTSQPPVPEVYPSSPQSSFSCSSLPSSSACGHQNCRVRFLWAASMVAAAALHFASLGHRG